MCWQSHPHIADLRNKPFPYYEDLLIVFSKDRASGEGAEDPADACEQIEKEEEALSDIMSLIDIVGEIPNIEEYPPTLLPPRIFFYPA